MAGDVRLPLIDDIGGVGARAELGESRMITVPLIALALCIVIYGLFSSRPQKAARKKKAAPKGGAKRKSK